MNSEPNSLNPDSLTARVAQLQTQIRDLQSERSDLEIMVETITEHSTDLENRIYAQNQQMQAYLCEVKRVTAAAAAVENNCFETASLNAIAARDDELGQLARVFQRMFEQVKSRERKLEQQVQELTHAIENANTKKQQRVNEILQDPSFQRIQDKVLALKKKRSQRR